MTSSVLIEKKGPALWLTINRPQVHNALNTDVIDGLINGFGQAMEDEEVRVVILTGAGEKSFCAGADLKPRDEQVGENFVSLSNDNPLVRLYRVIRACHKPIVGRINGIALGGGLGLVAACDLVYAASHAKFGTPEVKVGVFPMMIATYLIRQIPRRRFWEMAFLGEPLSVQEAVKWHLINEFSPPEELDERLNQVVKTICANSPNALRTGKKALDVMQDMTVDQTLALAQELIEKLSQSAEAQEGIKAFSEKRAPSWRYTSEGTQ